MQLPRLIFLFSGTGLQCPPSCDSCRVTFPLAEIDSVRAVSVEQAAFMTHGLVLGFTAATLLAWRMSDRDLSGACHCGLTKRMQLTGASDLRNIG